MDDGQLNSDEWWACFRKYILRFVGRVKGAELPYVQGPQSSEEDLGVWDRYPRVIIGHKSVSLAPT